MPKTVSPVSQRISGVQAEAGAEVLTQRDGHSEILTSEKVAAEDRADVILLSLGT